MRDVPITGVTTGKTIAHGGDLGDVRRRHPGAPQPWIDLSTGINPRPYPVVELPAESWSRLPSRDAEASLTAAAASRYRPASLSSLPARRR
jgi:cobalamin biosynthetic protein CobC